VSEPLRVGVVGVGALGRHHARLLSQIDTAKLAGVYDTDAARAGAVAAEFGTRAHASLAALLEAVDAVTVAVPTPAHADVGLAALARSRHVLMEKPLSTTVAEADALVEAAAGRRLVLQVGHVERFNRALRGAAAYLQDPRFITIERLAPFQPRGTDVAVILDLMIHDLDLVLEIVRADVSEVRAVGIPLLTPHVDIVNARREFTNGAVATVTASRVARERTRKVRIFQPSGYFSLDLGAGNGQFYRLHADWKRREAGSLEEIVEVIPIDAPEAEPLRLELESFIRAVRGEGEIVVSGAAGRAALALAHRVAEAVSQSQLAPSRP